MPRKDEQNTPWSLVSILDLKMHGLHGTSFKQEVALKQFTIKTYFVWDFYKKTLLSKFLCDTIIWLLQVFLNSETTEGLW